KSSAWRAGVAKRVSPKGLRIKTRIRRILDGSKDSEDPSLVPKGSMLPVCPPVRAAQRGTRDGPGRPCVSVRQAYCTISAPELTLTERKANGSLRPRA